jgi:hypothetical protein
MIKKNKITFLILIGIFLLLFLYRFSPRRIEFLGHYDKIWCHRVNETDKLKSAQRYFNGVELDITYRPELKKLELHHAGIASSRISLEEYLKIIPTEINLGLWLDIKELNNDNKEEILQLLQQRLKSYPHLVYSNIIIESLQAKPLDIFHENKFRTSYYLTLDSIGNPLQSKGNIKKILQQQNYLELSSDFRNYAFLTKNFPQRNKNFWVLTTTYNRNIVKDFPIIKELLNDEHVRTVLTPYNYLF